MSNNQDPTQLNSDVSILKGQIVKVNSAVNFIINNDPFLKMQKKIAHHSRNTYDLITDDKLKEELIGYSIKCQTALLCDEANEFGKYVFLQIESIISYGLFTKIGLSKINTDLQDQNLQVTLTNNQTQVTKTLVDHIFGWRTDKKIITTITSNTSIQEKEIQFTEKANLFFYYFIYLKQLKSFPDFDLTEVVKLIRDKSSHAQSTVVDRKNLIPAFEKEVELNQYQVCHKFYQHIGKFVKALI